MRRIPLLPSTLFASALLLCTPLLAAERPYVPVEQRLSADELRDTGLDTLSAKQLALLNRLLSEDREADLRAADAKRTQDEAGLAPKRTAGQAVTATVPGTVRGWTQGQTVLLDNGQRWRVVGAEVNFPRPVDNPKVTITPGVLGAWYLRTDDGMPPIKVKRVD